MSEIVPMLGTLLVQQIKSSICSTFSQAKTGYNGMQNLSIYLYEKIFFLWNCEFLFFIQKECMHHIIAIIWIFASNIIWTFASNIITSFYKMIRKSYNVETLHKVKVISVNWFVRRTYHTPHKKILNSKIFFSISVTKS